MIDRLVKCKRKSDVPDSIDHLSTAAAPLCNDTFHKDYRSLAVHSARVVVPRDASIPPRENHHEWYRAAKLSQNAVN